MATINPREAYLEAVHHCLVRSKTQTEGIVPEVGIFPVLKLSETPLMLYDIAGPLLFYLFFNLDKEGKINASIMTAADSRLPRMIYSVQYGDPGWDKEAVQKRAEELARSILEPGDTFDLRFVCYCFPKIGALIEIHDKNQKIKKTSLRDVGDWTEIPMDQEGEPTEGQTTYSFIRHLHGQGLESKNSIQRKTSYLSEMLDVSSEPKLAELQRLIKNEVATLSLAGSQSKILPVPLVGQETNVWCAVASAQMIFEFYGMHHSQSEIAELMHTGASGTTNDDQLAGYHKILGEGFRVLLDEASQWQGAREDVDGGFPLKSGIPGHARVCRGWLEVVQTRPDGSSFSDLQLVINDPWPKGKGSYREEPWDSVLHTNFIHARKT